MQSDLDSIQTLRNISHKRFAKRNKRQKRLNKRWTGFCRYVNDVALCCKKNKRDFIMPDYSEYRRCLRIGTFPEYDDVLAWLLEQKVNLPSNYDYTNGTIEVPEIFSLSDNEEKSMQFMHKLFLILHRRECDEVVIDYAKCTRIDLDASIIMDLIIKHFSQYYNKCQRRGHKLKVEGVRPTNYKHDDIERLLYTIGAYRTIKGVKLDFPNTIVFDLRIGDAKSANASVQKEKHETEIVDYVIDCLKRMNRTLNPLTEKRLSKVVGEVIANAEEHSHFRFRYAIGYFDTTHTTQTNFGVFNLVIFNFGRSFYQSFKMGPNQNMPIIKKMKQLSADFRIGKLFSPHLDEETLWTLYALQEGVTSLEDWERGNGSMRFIENFLALRSAGPDDNLSKLSLLSGRARIAFDGTYTPLSRYDEMGKSWKVMTFNRTGLFDTAPDRKYVQRSRIPFPGTMIVAKVCIGHENILTLNHD